MAELPIINDAHLLTHSSESTFKTCQRKYFLRYIAGLQPNHSADPLRFGTGFHLGLECFKNREPEDVAARAIVDLYADAECPPWLDVDGFATEMETVIAMIRGYYHRYAADGILEFIACEQPFELPITNPETGRPTPTYKSAGKIDGIAKLPDGRIALVEHKTTSESVEQGSDYWGRLLMDSQISRYVLAARAIGFDVQTTVFDVVRKPAIRPKAITKADRAAATHKGDYFGLPLTEMCPERETPKMFGARLLADLVERPEFYFARNEIARLDSDLEEFRREQWVLQQAIRESELKSHFWGASAFPRNTGACLTMGRCPFFDTCRGLTGDVNQETPNGFKRASVLHPELATVIEEK